MSPDYLDFAAEVGNSPQSIRRRAATSIRSLANENEQLKAKIAQLQKKDAETMTVRAFLAREGVVNSEKGYKLEFDNWLAKLKLEQQAKGIDWCLECRETNLSEGDVHTSMDKANQLRKQASEL